MGQFPSYIVESDTVDDTTTLVVNTEDAAWKGWDKLSEMLPPDRNFNLVVIGGEPSIEERYPGKTKLSDFLKALGTVYTPKAPSSKSPSLKAGAPCKCGSGIDYRKCCRDKKLRRRLKKKTH